MEKALIDAGSQVGLPYLDWFDIPVNGIPPILMDNTNPLSNYQHQMALQFNNNYPIPVNSPTHRYPYASYANSNNPADVDNFNSNLSVTTDQINSYYINTSQEWGIRDAYQQAIQTTSYADFTFNKGAQPSGSAAHALESPHDSGHGVIGSTTDDQFQGDMAYPDLAGFDPIFWLHHCFIDYSFNLWWANNSISVGDFPTDFTTNPLYLSFPKGAEKFGVFPGVQPVIDGNTTSWIITDDLLNQLKINENVVWTGVVPAPKAMMVSPFAREKVEYSYEVDRTLIKGPFTVYAKDKAGNILEKIFFLNRSDPHKCKNCVVIPIITFRFRLAEEPDHITYAMGFHGKIELSFGNNIKRI